ncbi:hypothetical protein SAMN06309944_1245 [Micrococcales bacterium KH10]|nr:hypothetical protein SAMN06309944_1245 [Micrococcales bacterium KH10]
MLYIPLAIAWIDYYSRIRSCSASHVHSGSGRLDPYQELANEHRDEQPRSAGLSDHS